MDEFTVERDQIDRRYESLRLPNKRQEKDLLDSISERGITQPLYGIKKDEQFILLDGFKRLRAGTKMNLEIFPALEIAETEREGMVKLLRLSNAKGLHFFEQVKIVNELHSTEKLTVRQISETLEKSSKWVGVRLGILKEFSDKVWEVVFEGKLPASMVLYTLRQMRRLHNVSKKDIDAFIDAVAGKNLGVRDLEVLAQGWFKGGDEMKEQIKNGDLSWTIEKAKELHPKGTEKDFSENEARVIKDLEIAQKYMERLTSKLP